MGHLAGRIAKWDAKFLHSIEHHTHGRSKIAVDDRLGRGGGGVARGERGDSEGGEQVTSAA